MTKDTKAQERTTLAKMRTQIQEARDYFDSEGTGPLDVTEAETSDKDGLLNFITVSEKVPSYLDKTFDEVRKDMISLAGIGTAFARRVAEREKKPELLYDTRVWEPIFNKFPLVGPSRFEEKSFNQKIKGIEISTKFLQTIFQATISSGAALKSFREFLADQGKTVSAGIQANSDGYRFGSISIVIEAVPFGDRQILVPKLKGYFLTFNRKDLKWTTGCASGNLLEVDFRFRTATTVFNYEALEDDQTKKAFRDLLRGRTQANIADSRNFFEADDFKLDNKD